MGREAICTARLGASASEGRALLETNELVFRGVDLRLAIPFKEISQVTAAGGSLQVWFPGGCAEFRLGEKAAIWAQEILNPKSRLDKLGVKAGLAVSVIGEPPAGFLEELAGQRAKIVKKNPELRFLFVEGVGGLKKLPAKGPLWIVYPKGRKHITESQVLEAGRRSGLVDIKVVSFSPTHTALKFTLPAKR